MSKTYILKENYGDLKRVTVDDDVNVNISSYESNHEGCLVKFSTPTVGYGENLIAAFGNTHSVYLEGTQIEVQEREYDEIAKATEPSDYKTKWVTVTTTA